LTNFKAADLTRVVRDDFFLTVLRLVVVLRLTVRFAVGLPLADCFAVDFLRVESAILLQL